MRNFLIFVLLLLSNTAFAQSIDYEKYTLANGMTVILHEDHSLPLAAVNIWYYVGAKDEDEGRSGFAHLFEHLMFNGTKRAPDFAAIIEDGGSWFNGTTNQDRTNYFAVGPASHLPTLLWLEADRMERLGNETTQERLDNQRDVVRNERRQNYENVPYGKSRYEINKAMYPSDHPYYHLTIGSHEDLVAAKLEDVKAFFAKYYVPNNASLVVAGDFNKDEIKPLIEELFATLPRGNNVRPISAKPAELNSVKRLLLEDDVQYPRISFVYHSPVLYRDGDAEMDLIGGILSDGVTSRLYRELVHDKKLANEVDAHQLSGELSSLFKIHVTANKDVSLSELEKAIDDVINDLLRHGPDADELAIQKAHFEAMMLKHMQSLHGIANALNSYEYFWGEPNSFKADIDRYRNATVKSVKKWAKRVLNPDERLILTVMPSKHVDNPRDKQPDAVVAQQFKPLMPEEFTLDNGLPVYYWQDSATPMTSFGLYVEKGTSDNQYDKQGLTTLVLSLLDKGAAGVDAANYQLNLRKLGAEFGFHAEIDYSTLTLSTLSKNIVKATSLYADAILKPNFDKVEYEQVLQLQQHQIARDQNNPRAIANNVSKKIFYGEHPYGLMQNGTIQSIESITLPDVISFHQSMLKSSRKALFVVSDLGIETIKKNLNQTLGTADLIVSTDEAANHQVKISDEKRLVIIDRPGAAQTVVRFVMPTVQLKDKDREKLQLLNMVLGGSYKGRLNANLRQDKGYTYGAYSSMRFHTDHSYLIAYASVNAAHTADAVKEFLYEFQLLGQSGVKENELKRAKAKTRMNAMGDFDNHADMLEVMQQLYSHKRNLVDLTQEMQQLTNIEYDDVNRLSEELLQIDNSILFLIGDKTTILTQIEGLGLPEPEEYDALGNKVSL